MYSKIDSKYLIGADFKFEGSDKSEIVSPLFSASHSVNPGPQKAFFAGSSLYTQPPKDGDENIDSIEDFDTLHKKVLPYLGHY